MRKSLVLLTVALLAAPSVFAVPTLQLYIEGADYDAGTDTWVTASSEFRLWVIAAHLDKDNVMPLHDITLVASLAQTEDPFGGSITLTRVEPPPPLSPTTYTGGDFVWGTPPYPPDDPIPSHGIYPTNHILQLVSASSPTDPNDWIPVQDYIPGGDGGTDIHGYMWGFDVSTTYSQVHFDAYGFLDNDRRIFAPFSHDAEMVPEPATALLLSLGLMGAGVYRRFKK